MGEFRNVLVVHERRDWGRAVQSLMDLDEDSFPYDYVSHLGMEFLVRLPSDWRFDEVYTDGGELIWTKDDPYYDRDSAIGLLNPTYYCSLLSALIRE